MIVSGMTICSDWVLLYEGPVHLCLVIVADCVEYDWLVILCCCRCSHVCAHSGAHSGVYIGVVIDV